MSAQPLATFRSFSHFCSDGGNKLSCKGGEGDKIACTLAQITQLTIFTDENQYISVYQVSSQVWQFILNFTSFFQPHTTLSFYN